ncbi:MAG: type II toxin-antitoxin system PemK/MazF family toxin [Spongiibacteraceae bacterium]|nr:type II toxin-antitoxin system PemK/MazF family toxin [Spongiibacteraceae bacterium]
MGCTVFFIGERRLQNLAIILKSAAILKFHKALVNRKYQNLYSSKSKENPGRKPLDHGIVSLRIEMKQRNPTIGYGTYCDANLSPTQESEQADFRPVLVISPNEMNDKLKTVIVAPMTTTLRGWPSCVAISHKGTDREVALDQLRTIDKTRLARCYGDLDNIYHAKVFTVLTEIFSE